MYSFGRENSGTVWTDAPHKLAYVWQMLCSQIDFPTTNLTEEELESDTIPAKITERFNKFKLLMELVSNSIKNSTNIVIDLSDLEIFKGDENNFYLGSVKDSLVECPWMDPSIDSAFRISGTAKIINTMLDSTLAPNIYEINQNTGNPQLTFDGHCLVEFFFSLLNFAFSEKSVIISHGECSDEQERECEKLIVEYVARNKGYCYIADTEAH